MPGPGGDRETMVIISERWRPALQALGYFGPWEVTRREAVGYIEDAKKYLEEQGQDLPGTPDVPQLPGDTIINVGGSSGPVGMTAAQKRNLRNAFLNQLRAWGINVTKNIENLVEKGVTQEWSMDSFVLYLRATDEYQRVFQGIEHTKGQFRSEDEYIRQYDIYQKMAAKADYELSRSQFALLLKKGVDAEEWNTRTIFLDRITRNGQFFSQVEKVAQARGILKPKENLSPKELYDVMLHKGSPQIERLLEEANVRFQLKGAGFMVGAGGVGRKQVLSFIRKLEGSGIEAEALTPDYFAGLAEKLKEVIPIAKQIGMNVTKRDLFTLEFGGPGRNEIARYVENALASHEAEEAGTAGAPMLIQDEGGSRLLSGAIERPKTAS